MCGSHRKHRRHLIAKIHVKTASREVTTETFNVTQSDLSNSSPVCQCPLPTASVVTEVELFTKVVANSSLVVRSTVDGSEVKVKVKVVVGGVAWEAQCGR